MICVGSLTSSLYELRSHDSVFEYISRSLHFGGLSGSKPVLAVASRELRALVKDSEAWGDTLNLPLRRSEGTRRKMSDTEEELSRLRSMLADSQRLTQAQDSKLAKQEQQIASQADQLVELLKELDQHKSYANFYEKEVEKQQTIRVKNQFSDTIDFRTGV